jgi:hypothetical protein
VRQSSLYQVEHHLESQKRQYQLTDRAQQLGWAAARCIVIDEDLGISGAEAASIGQAIRGSFRWWPCVK